MLRKPEDDLDALLAGQSADERASILRDLLEEHQDPKDPLFKLLRILKVALEVSEQTIQVSEQIPFQLQGLLSEIDEKFDFRVSQWRGLPPEILATFRDALLGIIPEIQEQAKASALTTAAAQLDQLAHESASALEEFKGELRSAALSVMKNVSQQTAAHVRSVDPEKLKLWTRFNTLLFATGLCLLGAFGGYGWAQAHLTYPPGVQKNIEAGEQYRAMYPHMPPEMQAWIKRWMAAQ